MWLLDRLLGPIIKRGQIVITEADGQVHTYGAHDPGLQSVALRFNDAGVARKIVSDFRLGFAEAYMDGRIDFERGDVFDLITLVSANRRWEDMPPAGSKVKSLVGRLRGAIAARNHEARSKRNVAHHYDIGNSLYRLFLDDDLQYSCAYFTDPGNSLEQAQSDKKAHIAAKLFLKPGQRVLDIGCGWGGLALYLHRHYGVEVLGVTLSEEQLALARERAKAAGVEDKVRFELTDYRKVEGSFDRIVSIGMFEHVGLPFYPEFFRTARRLLKPDGVMLLHTIGRFDFGTSGDAFAEKHIFPGYYLPNLSQIVSAAEPTKLIASDIETLRLHYAYTLRHWLARCRAQRGPITDLYDEKFFRMWEIYLSAACAMFETGGGCVYQLQYVRSRTAVPITRDYLFEEERRLRELDGAVPSRMAEKAPIRIPAL